MQNSDKANGVDSKTHRNLVCDIFQRCLFDYVLQVDSLKIALKHLRNENIRLKSQQLKVRYQMNSKTAEYGKNASSTFVKFRKKFRNLRRPDARLPCHWCVSFFIP